MVKFKFHAIFTGECIKLLLKCECANSKAFLVRFGLTADGAKNIVADNVPTK